MPTSLNSGFENNINVIEIRVNGAHQMRYTDRPITNYAARAIVSEVTETDGGVHTDNDVSQFTEGTGA